jgi:hypothetical protein
MAEPSGISSESDSDEDVIISHIKTALVGMEKRIYGKEKNSR